MAEEATGDRESRRFSIDVDEDFQRWLEEKRRNKTGANKSDSAPLSAEDTFVTLEKMCDKSVSDVDSTLYKYLNAADREQVLAEAKLRCSSDHRQAEKNTPVAGEYYLMGLKEVGADSILPL